jgi:hypothetical protein
MIANGSTGLSFATVSLTVEPKGFKWPIQNDLM